MFSRNADGSCDSETRPDISECSENAASSRKLAFENLLRKYYHQVTHGCGNTKCTNKSCAQNRPIPVGNDEGAAIALQLVKERASLCVMELPKVPVQDEIFLTEEKLNEVITSCQQENDFKPLVRLLGDVFTRSSSLNNSFPLQSNNDGVELESVRKMYEILFNLQNSAVENTLINSLGTLSTDIEVELKRRSYVVNDTNFFKQFLIIFENPYLNQSEYLENALPCFCKAVSLLPLNIQLPLIHEWSKHSVDSIKKKVETLQHLVTLRVLNGPSSNSQSMTVNDDPVIVHATKCMKLFHYASLLGGKFDQLTEEPMDTDETVDEETMAKKLGLDVLDCREPLLPFDAFINEPLNEEIAIDRDFTSYKRKKGFSFMECNFILTTQTKSICMFYDNRVHMLQERRLTHLYSLLRGQDPTPYLKLTVRRDNLIQDALVNLEMIYQDNPLDLKKQLFVEFAGEEGQDEGGVSKEFFQLIVEHLFNPDYGMFTYDLDTRLCWFNQTSFESHDQFTLIGLLLGLAIYNSVILDVHFPMVVYRKLFGRNGSLFDLKDSHPVIANSLQNILHYEGDVENTFLCIFAISYQDVFGNVLTDELMENGKDIPVTNENRKNFVDLYVDYILNKSIEDQFRPFKQGFDMVTKDSPLKQLFRPEEVELLVCGSKDFDFVALERATEYEGGFTETTPIMRWFWDIVHKFSIEQKRQLLMFITGSDRVPIGGLAKLKIVIARQGPDSNSLPTAHTCFNVLLIPDYSKKSQLEERLVKAITYSKGFGLL